MFRFLAWVAVAAVSLTCFADTSQAAWPEKPVKFLLGSSAGSSIDTVGRFLAQKLSEKFGQPFVPQNVNGGGNGALSMVLKRTNADGYTISLGGDSMFGFNSLMPGAQFTPEDFEYVAAVFSSDAAWICAADKPWKDLREALEWARANNKALVYLTQTRADRLMIERISREMEVTLDIIPSKGPSAIITGLLGNHGDIGFSGGFHYEQERAGKIKSLAINTPKPSIIYPAAPLSKDLFKSAMPHEAVRIVVVPKGFPEDIKAALEKALFEICSTQEYKDLLIDQLHFIPVWQDGATATAKLMAYHNEWKEELSKQK